MNKAVKGSVVLFAFLLLTGCTQRKTTEYQDPESVSYEIRYDTEVIDEEAVLEAVEVVEDNLRYSQDEDIEGYKSTIVEEARENTEKELESFFNDYDLEHTVLSVKVLEQEEASMLLEVAQQSVVIQAEDGAEEYRDHVAIANHTLIPEDGSWKIADTTMTETLFIE